MPKFNQITVIGHIGRKPEVRYTQNGKAVATISVPYSDKYGDSETTTWYDAEIWGKSAEAAAQYLDKGMCVLVTGTHVHETFERDGQVYHKDKIKFASWQNMERRQQSQQVDDYDIGELGPPLNMDDAPLSPGE